MAQVAAQLDIAGSLAAMHSSIFPEKFRPLHLRYLQYLPQDNSFKLLLDKGSLKPNELNGPNGLNEQAKELMKYFFIGLSLPNDSFWVNLRPDSPDEIIDPYLAQTDIGKILLEADLELKKDTARATSPQTPEGKKYWDSLYKKAGELFGSENVTIPTLTRPWIVPDEIIIRETTDSAYVYKATLKVMLEQDYLEVTGHRSQVTSQYQFDDSRLKELNEYSSQLIKETIIPKLTKEINTSKKYASLRQVYYSLILAQWFKARSPSVIARSAQRDEAISRLINSRNLANLTAKESYSKDTYFQAYQKSFKDGEYNIQEPVYSVFGQTIRSYFSGGEIFDLGSIPQMGGVTRNSSTGSIVSSIPTASSPAVNPKVVVGVKVNATDNLGELGQVQIESHGIEVSMSSGQMKSLGIRDPMDEDTELDLSRRHAKFEALAASVQPENIYGIQARVVQSDLGNTGADHFNSAQYGLIIVVNSKYPNTWEEGKFHEVREVYWMSKGFSQHEAHVIASAEQIQRFSRAGEITSYHLSQLENMTPEGLQTIQQENENIRQWHYRTLERANISNANIDILRIKEYEKKIRLVASRQEQIRMANLVESIQKKRISSYTSKLRPMSFDKAIVEARRAYNLGQEKEILISEPLTIDHLKQFAYLPFEVSLLRLRGAFQWVMKVGKTRNVVLKFAVIDGKDETSLLGDILIHNHPNQGKPMASGPDILNQFSNVGIPAWVIGSEGMHFYNTDNLRHSEDEEENLDFSYWVLEKRIPRGGWKTDSQGRYTEETFRQWASIYRELDITFGFIPWTELSIEDLAKDTKNLDTALYGSSRKARYLALKQLFEIGEPANIAPFLWRFAKDESRKIQSKTLSYLEEHFNPDNSAMVNSVRAFTESRFNDIKIKAFEILLSNSIKDDSISEGFTQLITQNTLWGILGQMRYNQNVVQFIAQNYGTQIRSQVSDATALNSIKLSPIAVEVLLQLNLSGVFLEYLNQMKNTGSGEKLEDAFESLAYSNRGIRIIIDFVDRNYGELDWDLQFRTVMILSSARVSKGVISRVAGRIPFDYFHRTFKNDAVDPGGGKTSVFMERGFLDKYTSDPNPSIARRAKIMKSVWEKHAGTDLPTARKIYLDSVSRAGFGQDDSGGGSMKPLGLREPLTDETVMGDSTAKVARDEAARRDSGELLSPQDQIPPEDSISTTPRQMGGIDFRNLPIVTQAIGNLNANIGSSSISRFNSVNLTSEWRDIENLVNSGITPSAERIKEYVQASCYKGSVDRDIDKVISCISDILRIEEERYSSTDPTLKDILVVLDSANSIQQLKAVFIGSTP